MYDSRTDRPVLPGTHHAGHAFRLNCVEPGKGDRIEDGTPRSRRLATPKAERAAIAEGLAEWHADLDERAEADLILDEHATFTNWLPGEYGDLTLWAVWHDQRCYGC